MKMRHVLALGLLGLLGFLCLVGFGFAPPQSLQRQNEVLFGQLQSHGLSDDQIDGLARDGGISCGGTESSAGRERRPGGDEDRAGTPARRRR